MEARNIVVAPAACVPVEARATELCEHKGVGHPDTITDAVCEAASRALSQAYLAACGRVLHHNLDKGLLVAGRSAPRFGGGELLAPVRITIAGRATRVDGRVEPARIAADAARRELAGTLRCPPGTFEIATEIREGAANLQEVFARGGEVPLANDTSFGTGFAPFSTLERTVLEAGRLLASPELRDAFPCAGDDFKVMGLRVEREMRLTVALAFVDRHVGGVREYIALKAAICDYLSARLGGGVLIRLNTLDDPAARDERGIYLTVCGLSAEMGDDGQVGRGNRASGLITPGRPMSLEATAGKNPVSHVGKLYNVAAMRIAAAVHREVPGAASVGVELLSTIGAPIDRPQVASIEIAPAGTLTDAMRAQARAIADEHLARIGELTEAILAGRERLF
ncbi:MAG: methionine adenosyltransferase [Burkholderiales bacterium]|nr:methionine adenosyltransferase [Burkholderiales bacterium]